MNYGQKCGNTCQKQRNEKEKQKWTIEKLKLDNARKLRGIHFIDPADEEFKEIVRNARRKLENPMPAAMPCKTPIRQISRETCRGIGKHKTKIRFVLSKLTNL